MQTSKIAAAVLVTPLIFAAIGSWANPSNCSSDRGSITSPHDDDNESPTPDPPPESRLG